jgi:hypothetical protein
MELEYKEVFKEVEEFFGFLLRGANVLINSPPDKPILD